MSEKMLFSDTLVLKCSRKINWKMLFLIQNMLFSDIIIFFVMKSNNFFFLLIEVFWFYSQDLEDSSLSSKIMNIMNHTFSYPEYLMTYFQDPWVQITSLSVV